MLPNLVSYWPAWLAIGMAVLLTLNQLITESQKFANLLGGLGRKLHDRAKRRNRMDAADFAEALREAVTKERERWEADEARALVAMEKRLDYIGGVAKNQQEEMKVLSWDVRCLTAYTEYEANWHHRLRMIMLRANANGGRIPIEDLPEHMHYQEFENECKTRGNMNWRSWNRE